MTYWWWPIHNHRPGAVASPRALGFIVHPKIIADRFFKNDDPVPANEKNQKEALALLKWSIPPTARKVATLLEEIKSVSQTVPPGPAILQANSARPCASPEAGWVVYKSMCPLSDWRACLVDRPLAEVVWEYLGVYNQSQTSVESDTSLIGWGVSSWATLTGGLWSSEETQLHSGWKNVEIRWCM